MIVPVKATAERIRLRYLYRRLILSGEVKVSSQTARRIVGPDCAYHLYGKHGIMKGKVPGIKGKGKPPEES